MNTQAQHETAFPIFFTPNILGVSLKWEKTDYPKNALYERNNYLCQI